MILPLLSLERSEHLNQVLYVFKTKHRFASSTYQERIGEGKAGPGQGKGAYLVGLRISKEDSLLSPSKALCQQGKGLATQGMKGMGDGKAVLTIRVIRCS